MRIGWGLEAHSVRQALALGAKRLKSKGVPDAARDAALLLAEAMRTSTASLYVRSDSPLSEEEASRFEAMLARREKLEPVAYILGRREFFGFTFRCDSRALIPRPETELVVEEVLGLAAEFGGGRLLDVGTGSGCIALSFAALCGEKWSVVASDISEAALQLARENARRLGLDDARVRFVLSDLFEKVIDEAPFNLVVSNPPYVAGREWDRLPRDVREYEPKEALYGGEDGLAVIGRILAEAPAALCSGGWLVLEIGEGQAEQVEEMARSAGRYDPAATRARRDLAGIQRVAAFRVG